MSTCSIGRIAPHRRHVRVRLRAAAEHEQPPRVGRREVPHRQRGDGRRAQVGKRDAVHERARRQRLAIEDHAHALDARLAPDRDQLHHGVAGGGRRHEQQLALLELDDRALRVRFRVETCP